MKLEKVLSRSRCEHVEIGDGPVALAALRGQLRHVIGQRLLGVDQRRFRARARFRQRRAHVDALLQGGDQLLLRLHGAGEAIALDLLLLDLRVVIGDGVGELPEIASQHLVFARLVLLGHVVRP